MQGSSLGDYINKTAAGFAVELIGDSHRVSIRFHLDYKADSQVSELA